MPLNGKTILLTQEFRRFRIFPSVWEKTYGQPHIYFSMNNSRKRRGKSLQTKATNGGCASATVDDFPKSKRLRKDAKSKDLIQQDGPAGLDTVSSKTQAPCSMNEEELLKRFSVRREYLRKNNIASSTHVFRKLCDSFETSRDPAKATAMSKYLRFQFEFLGIQTPQRRELCKPLWKEIKVLNSSDLRTLICEAWLSPEREFQNFAVDLFEKECMRIYSDDGLGSAEYATSTLDFARQFLASPKSWWDTVDPLAYKVVGPLVKKYPEYLLSVMDAWNVSGVTWLARTSIIYQLGYGKDTDAERLFRYCLKVAHEEEFFIQKAIGWALRQHCRVDQEAVKAFVQKNKKKLSTLSIREALKYVK